MPAIPVVETPAIRVAATLESGGGNRGGGNRGGVGRGNPDGEQGNAGNQPGGNPGRGNRGGGRGDDEGDPANTGNQPEQKPGRGNADNADDAQGGGRGRRQKGESIVANMKPHLRARLEAMLPAGMTLEQAAEGFRNQGRFIAALQQSHNHDISFVDLKKEMTGDTPLNLGPAMRKLRVQTDED